MVKAYDFTLDATGSVAADTCTAVKQDINAIFGIDSGHGDLVRAAWIIRGGCFGGVGGGFAKGISEYRLGMLILSRGQSLKLAGFSD